MKAMNLLMVQALLSKGLLMDEGTKYVFKIPCFSIYADKSS